MAHSSLGVIGGMGPKATSVFFDRLIERTVASQDQEHLDIIIVNHAKLPDRTRIIANNDHTKFLDLIEKDIRLLEHAGVSHIAIPCNTSHYFYHTMQAMTAIRIINMVEETIQEIYNQYGAGSRVGLLGTQGTVNSGVYEKGCLQRNLELVLPSHDEQQQVMDVIYKVKAKDTINIHEFEGMISHLIVEKQCDCVILACTELSLLPLSQEVINYCVDAMEVLVKTSIELSGGMYKY